jgi:hypothetical protein
MVYAESNPNAKRSRIDVNCDVDSLCSDDDFPEISVTNEVGKEQRRRVGGKDALALDLDDIQQLGKITSSPAFYSKLSKPATEESSAKTPIPDLEDRLSGGTITKANKQSTLKNQY